MGVVDLCLTSSKQIDGEVDWSFVKMKIFGSYEILSSDSFCGDTPSASYVD